MIVAAAAGLAAIALLAAAGDRFRCSVVKQGERILGFLISIADGDTAIAYHIGFDREAAQGLPVYLRLLHAGIADGIDLGCKQVSFGRTALEPKAALGAKPRAFGVLVRHRQPVLNKLIGGLRAALGGEFFRRAAHRIGALPAQFFAYLG